MIRRYEDGSRNGGVHPDNINGQSGRALPQGEHDPQGGHARCLRRGTWGGTTGKLLLRLLLLLLLCYICCRFYYTFIERPVNDSFFHSNRTYWSCSFFSSFYVFVVVLLLLLLLFMLQKQPCLNKRPVNHCCYCKIALRQKKSHLLYCSRLKQYSKSNGKNYVLRWMKNLPNKPNMIPFHFAIYFWLNRKNFFWLLKRAYCYCIEWGIGTVYYKSSTDLK